MRKTKKKRVIRKRLPWFCIDCRHSQITTPNNRFSSTRPRCMKCGGLLMAKKYLPPEVN